MKLTSINTYLKSKGGELNVKIHSYDDWCNTLTDEYMQTVEDEDLDLMDLYEDYVSIAQDIAYDNYKDNKIFGE